MTKILLCPTLTGLLVSISIPGKRSHFTSELHLSYTRRVSVCGIRSSLMFLISVSISILNFRMQFSLLRNEQLANSMRSNTAGFSNMFVCIGKQM